LPFSEHERAALLAVQGVGPTVVDRLEQIGISCLRELRDDSAEEVTEAVAQLLKTICRKNSPQAKAAIRNAIDLASDALNRPNGDAHAG